VCAKIFNMSLGQEQRTDNMTFFLDGISWLSLVMDLALLIGVAVYQVGLCYFCDVMQIILLQK
jgi:hypothetical protein